MAAACESEMEQRVPKAVVRPLFSAPESSSWRDHVTLHPGMPLVDEGTKNDQILAAGEVLPL